MKVKFPDNSLPDHMKYDGPDEVELEWKTTHVEARTRRVGYYDASVRRYLFLLPYKIYRKALRVERILRWKYRKILRKLFNTKVLKFVPLTYTLEPADEMVCYHPEGGAKEIERILLNELGEKKRNYERDRDAEKYWGQELLKNQKKFDEYMEKNNEI